MTTRKTLPKAAATKATPKKRVPAPPSARQTKQVGGKAAEKSAALHPVTPAVASIPDMSVADKYRGRKINGKSDMETFDWAFDQCYNVLIEGPTGCGKTMATRAWAALRGKHVARIPSNSGIDASQLFGKFNPDKINGGFVWVDGPVTYVFRHGGVILWNEINFTPERVGSVMFGSLDDQREIVLLDHDSEVIRAHRGTGNPDKPCWCNLSDDDCNDRRVLIVADMNPGYQGTRELNDALRNRFGVQLPWDYDPVVEASLIVSDSLRELAAKIRGDEDYETPVSTNMLMEFEKIAKGLSIDFAVGNFVNHFRAEEREPIKLVAEAHKGDIEDQLNPKKAVPAPVDDDDDDTVSVDDLADWVFASAD